MTRNKSRAASPRLELHIGPEQRQRAIDSNSGGCLIADAIKNQYPHLSSISVDMATIRVSDRAKGERYTYLTPPAAQHVLLAFDQGWPNPSEQLTIQRAVKITPITRSKQQVAERTERLEDLRLKQSAGRELTRAEHAALTRMERNPNPEPPAAKGPSEVLQHGRGPVVRGGNPMPQGPTHPNLLRGRDRIFGAKMADPGKAFTEAVEAAVSDELAKRTSAPENPSS